jgi:hypothetical protein
VVIVGLLLGLTARLATACGSGTRGHHPSAPAFPQALVGAPPVPTQGHWIASWSASPEAAPPATPFAGGFRDQTIRNVIYTGAGGSLVRVRLDNTFGGRVLEVARAAIAVAGPGAAVLPGTSGLLSFPGRRSTVIPSGEQTFSDPVRRAGGWTDPRGSIEVGTHDHVSRQDGRRPSAGIADGRGWNRRSESSGFDRSLLPILAPGTEVRLDGGRRQAAVV